MPNRSIANKASTCHMVHPMKTVRVPAQPKAYSYIRFSTPQQAKGDSHRRQADKAARYAEEHGLALDSDLNLTDFGVSAYRGKNAKTGALGVFLRAVEDGTVPRGSFLLVENIDRLTREDVPDATMLFLQIINAGIVVVTLTNRERYSRERLNSGTSRHLLHHLGAYSRQSGELPQRATCRRREGTETGTPDRW